MNPNDRHHQPDPTVVKTKLIALGTALLTGLALLVHFAQ